MRVNENKSLRKTSFENVNEECSDLPGIKNWIQLAPFVIEKSRETLDFRIARHLDGLEKKKQKKAY